MNWSGKLGTINKDVDDDDDYYDIDDDDGGDDDGDDDDGDDDDDDDDDGDDDVSTKFSLKIKNVIINFEKQLNILT